MNDDLMSRLDDRGRSAGAAAHGAVSELPIPDFDPDLVRVSLDDDPTTGAVGPGGRGDRRWLAVVGIAAALLVVALGAALASRAGDDDSAPTDNVGTTDQVRPYVAGWLPEGLQLSNVADGGRSLDEMRSYTLAVFGPSVDDPRVAIASVSGATSIEDQIAEGDESYRSVGTVGGREVFTRDDEQPITYVFDEGGRQVVILPADSTDEGTVLEVAGAVELDGADVALADPPHDWEQLGEVDDPFLLASGGAAESHHVTYSGPRVESDQGVTMPTATVSSSSGSALTVSMMRLLTHDFEEVVVRGHPAILGRIDFGPDGDPGPSQWVLAWQQAPGEVLQVVGIGIARDEVLAVAEDVRTATSTEWEDLRQTSVITPGPDEELVGSGRFSDGSVWALMVTDDGSGTWASLRTLADGGDQASAGSATGGAIDSNGEPIEVEPPALPEISRGGGDPFAWAYGLLDPTSGAAVTQVVVVDRSGAEVAEAVLVGGGDLRGWVVEIPAGLIPPGDVGIAGADGGGSSGASGGTETTMLAGGPEDLEGEVEGAGDLSVVAYAADGTELARQPLP